MDPSHPTAAPDRPAPDRRRKPRKKRILLAAAAVLALVVVAGVAWFQPSELRSTPPSRNPLRPAPS